MMATIYTPSMPTRNGLTITSVDYQQDSIPYTLMHNTYKPDPAWTFTDYKGHLHGYGTPADPWPSLVERSRNVTWFDDGYLEEYTESWLQCRLCHQVIQPGQLIDKRAGVVYHMPGMATITIRGVGITGVVQVGQQFTLDVPHVGSCTATIDQINGALGGACEFTAYAQFATTNRA